MEIIRVKDKLKERFSKTKRHVDHERFKEQRNSVQQKIKNKKVKIVNQSQKNTKKPISLPFHAAIISKICLEENHFTQFDDKQNPSTCKNFYSKLASDLVEKLPNTQ